MPASYPLDTVVYITDTIGGEEFQGSGVLISPDEVLTASHVVYSETDGTASDIEVTPDYDGQETSPGGMAPFGTAAGVTIHYNTIQDADDEITEQQSQYDYAVIHLSTKFTDLGTMGLESNYPGGAATVSGYPAIAEGVLVTKPETIGSDGVDTVYDGVGLGPGSSGGPVWIDGTGGPSVVGVVSSGDNATDAGYFTEITTSAFDTIESWVQQDDANCFLQGTRIATIRGDVPVEALTKDDVVLTRFGGPCRIQWIGHRRVACSRHPRPHDVLPVRIAAGAFGPGRPCRDLLLSPDHAVLVRGALIPVRYLINNATIMQERLDVAIYWHVELPRHDVLFAEALAVESYLDTGNRAAFDNAGSMLALHPDFARKTWRDGCAPLVSSGRRLATARRHLAPRAMAFGYTVSDDPGLTILVDGRTAPVIIDDGVRRVRLSAGAGIVRVVSRTWVPEHNGDVADRRRLGIAVSHIWLDGREVALDSAGLSLGWLPPEANWRWTDGDGQLAVAGARELAFTVAMTGTYWLPPRAAAPADQRRSK